MKVTLHAGLTFPVGIPGSNQFARLDITFTDVEIPDDDALVEETVKAQLKRGKWAAARAYSVISHELTTQAEDVYNDNAPKSGRRPKSS